MSFLHSIPEVTHKDREHTLKAVFETRYAWLLRWALHFTENDRAAAEDLVQETFVRLLLSWDTLRDPEDLEPLLYSYLRYAHLSERRRGRSHAFQRLSSADFDTLAISLRNSVASDQIEVQNEIREILAFLLWRKRSARFASVFLLRFFHGYFPEEIASICISKRFAVDLALRQARQELKAHLSNPRQIHVLGGSPLPEQKSLNLAVPIDEFEYELRRKIFSSSGEPCPSPTEFDRFYNSLNQKPLECGTLAHIVGCESCLDRAAKRCGTPPPSSRSMDDSFGRAPRGKGKKTASDKQRLARVFAEGESRMREIYEHHPVGLAIALNAEVVAIRDLHVNVPKSVLKVETHAVLTLDIIEVFSEQGLLLISMPVLQRPPKSQPELRHEIALSDDRTLSLIVRFTSDGALIETVYENPHCAPDLETESFLVAEDQAPGPFEANADSEVLATTPTRKIRRRFSRWPRLLGALQFNMRSAALLLPAGAILGIVLLFIASIVDNREAQRIDANQLLRAAVRAESTARKTSEPSAVVQRIQIKASGHVAQRNLYRDALGKRRAKELPVNDDERVLREKLAEAELDWNNPLSVENYRDWHDHLYREEERVVRTGVDLLTVSTRAAEGLIAQETLTVKANDFHAVARTVLFRDGESIEIAELSYQVVPWSPQVDQWFEPLPRVSSGDDRPLPMSRSMQSPRLSDTQLDVAELSVMLVLQELHADTERLQMTRSPTGVLVKGIVDSDDRKAQITARLRMIEHVSPSISSYRDLDAKAAPEANASRLQQVSVADAKTPLTAECEQRKIAPDPCRHMSYELLNASAVLVRESKHIVELRVEYPLSRPLTSRAKLLLSEIASERLRHINAALEKQEGLLRQLGAEPPHELETAPLEQLSLEAAAQRNLALAKELVYVAGEHARPALIILQELAKSTATARTTVAREATEFQTPSALSLNPATPMQ